MNDVTEGTHADTDPLEPERKTDVYPGEPDVDDREKNGAELGDIKAALDEETQ